jgi:hypothetical protein
MRSFLTAVLGVIAVGVLLIAYGVINPRTVSTEPFQVWRTAGERVSFRDDGSAESTPRLELRCEPGQRAVVRQVAAVASARCVDDAWAGETPRATRASLVYPTADERTISYARPAAVSQFSRRAAVRTDRRRDWGKTAMVIGGSSAAGAGLGALFGGQKGALIGAAIGGGAGTLYEVKH